jgi:hypothetical protein
MGGRPATLQPGDDAEVDRTRISGGGQSDTIVPGTRSL